MVYSSVECMYVRHIIYVILHDAYIIYTYNICTILIIRVYTCIYIYTWKWIVYYRSKLGLIT